MYRCKNIVNLKIFNKLNQTKIFINNINNLLELILKRIKILKINLIMEILYLKIKLN